MKRTWFYGRHGETCPVSTSQAVHTRDLRVRYPDVHHDVLLDISLDIAAGTCVALVGHNGAGKSTFLKTLAGLLPVRSGELIIYGHPADACHHRVAYLSQRSSLNWDFPATLEELVMSGRYVHLGWMQAPAKTDWEVVAKIIADLGLEALAKRRINQLSGGQQQRMLLARALAQAAQLLLLDEPLNALDQESRQFLTRMFAQLKTQGKTILVSTHDHDDLGAEFDQVIYLFEGRVMRQVSTPIKKRSL